jgi:ELWxxDGT repeat protein
MLRKIGGGIWWALTAIIATVVCTSVGCMLFRLTLISTSLTTSLTEIDATRLTEFNGQLVFFVTKRYENPRNRWVMWTNWELWTSDGTPDGTMMVKPVYTGWNQPVISPAAISNKRFFFEANGVEDKAEAQSWKNSGGMWCTDGTAAGTTRVEMLADEMLDINGTLFFTRWGNESCDLYRSDGTDPGTSLIKHIAERCTFRLTGRAGRLFFATTLEEPQRIECKLWSSDGTSLGTSVIKQFQVKPGNFCVRDMVMFDDRLVMLLTERGRKESELWSSDGTASGTVLMREIPGTFIENRNFRILHVVGDRLFFSSTYTDQKDECALWVSDGTPGGTHRLKTVCLNQYSMAPVGDELLFAVDVPGGWELWRSDGTPEGTQLVRDGFTFGRDGYRPGFLLVDRETLYLAIHDNQGCALWRSDGTARGTIPFHRGCPQEMVSVDGTAFFVLLRNEQQIELWKSDGTSQGTVAVKAIP